MQFKVCLFNGQVLLAVRVPPLSSQQSVTLKVEVLFQQCRVWVQAEVCIVPFSLVFSLGFRLEYSQVFIVGLI